MLEEAISIVTATNNSFASMNAHESLARAHTLRGDPRAAAHAHLAAAQIASRCGDRGYVYMAVAGVACRLAEAGDPDNAVLLGTWAAHNADWPDDWMTIPGFVSGETLARTHDALAPAEREQLMRDAESIDHNDALALAATCVNRLGQDP
jgi:hypothetical protein